MNQKSLIWFLMIVGTTAGAYMPLLWGDSGFSMPSVVLSGLGGILGIWLGYKIGKYL